MKEFEDLKLYAKRERLSYLNNTRDIAIEALEFNTPEDEAIKTKRQQARTEIALIDNAIEYSDIQHLTIDF